MRKLVLVSILAFMVCITCGCKPNTDTASGGSVSGGSSSTTAVAEVSSKAQTSSEEAESKNSLNSEASNKTSSKTEAISSKPSSTSSTSNTSSQASNISSTSNTQTNISSQATSTSSTTEKKDYLDESLLTYTQADVGKVIGYSSAIGEDITVVDVREGTTVTGLKYIDTIYSYGRGTSIVECKYCHKMPCPNGGDEDCPEYDTEEDATVTCQTCGKPRGNGYNGTCKNLIDWANGGKISCNYYD